MKKRECTFSASATSNNLCGRDKIKQNKIHKKWNDREWINEQTVMKDPNSDAVQQERDWGSSSSSAQEN